MAKTEVEFTVETPSRDVWSVLSNLETVGSCLPFIEKAEILEGDICRWFVRSPMNSITRTSFIDATVESVASPNEISLTGRGEHLKLRIEFLLSAALSHQTEVAKLKER